MLDERRGRPLFFIDIAVPRDVDPAVDELENVYLYNIDDLEGLVAESLVRREAEITKAGQLVEAKANGTPPWYDSWRRGATGALRHNPRESLSVGGTRMTLLKIGTRGSALALAQSRHVKKCLESLSSELQVESASHIKTTGDGLADASLASIGGKAFLQKSWKTRCSRKPWTSLCIP